MGEKKGLSPRDSQIAALVASGLTYAEAGAQLKLSERTIRRAMERTELRAEVDRIRERTVEAGLGKLCDGFIAAVDELRRLVGSGEPKDSVKLGAVRLAIESVLKVRESVVLAREVAELRRLLDEPPGGSSPPEEDRGGAPGEPRGGGEPERAEPRPDGDLHEGGEPPGPVASGADDRPLDAGFASGFASGGQV